MPHVVAFTGTAEQREWLRQVRTEVRDAFPAVSSPQGWIDWTDDFIESTNPDTLASSILREIDNATIVVHLARRPGGWAWSVVTWRSSAPCKGVRDILSKVQAAL